MDLIPLAYECLSCSQFKCFAMVLHDKPVRREISRIDNFSR